MSKKIILVIVAMIIILIILAIAGYIFFQKKNASGAPEDAAQKAISGAIKGAELPSLPANPLEDKPDINPANKTNPFSNLKTNPFK